MNKDRVYKKIKNILSEELEVNQDKINLATNLEEDLGADSLDAVELIMAIEDEFNIDIPDELLKRCTVVYGAVEVVLETIKNKAFMNDPITKAINECNRILRPLGLRSAVPIPLKTYRPKKVSDSKISEIIDTMIPWGMFYNKIEGGWIGIDNTTGDAWTEEFLTEERVINWLTGMSEEVDTGKLPAAAGTKGENKDV